MRGLIFERQYTCPETNFLYKTFTFLENMKKSLLSVFMLISAAAFSIAAPAEKNKPVESKPETFLLEAEHFQFIGDWSVDGDLGQRMLIVTVPTKSAPTTVFKAKGGKYHVWFSARDYEKISPASRKMKVAVNGKQLDGIGGTHKREGFYWQKMGETELIEGENVVSIVPLTSHMRADAVLFTQDETYNPNEKLHTRLDRAKIRKAPEKLDYVYNLDMERPKQSDARNGKSYILSNDKHRVAFVEKIAADGTKTFERNAQTLVNGKWVSLEPFKEDALYLMYSENNPRYTDGFFASWGEARNTSTITAKLSGGKEQIIPMPPVNPYCIGQAKLLNIVSIKPDGANALILDYGDGIKAKVTMMPKGGALKYEVSTEADRDGWYSFCFINGNSVDKKELKAVELPTIYQLQRVMVQPKLVANRITSHPLSMIEVDEGGKSVVSAVVADPDNLPFGEWSEENSSIYGFTLASPEGRIQTAIFQPIIGGRNSQKKEGDEIKASFYVLNFAGNWLDGIEYVDTNLFDCTKLREAYDVSFSDAICNIADYLKNKEASGWSDLHKGRWNIEAADTVTHSTPLTELSIALLTDSEDFYKNFSLPTIEYTLSRNASHFAPGRKIAGSWFRKEMTKLAIGSAIWGADYYAGVNRLTGNANPFFKDFYYNNKGKLNTQQGDQWYYNLGIYLADPSPELLEKVKADCDKWLKNVFYKPLYDEVNLVSFINAGTYHYWWYLPEIYALTGDKKYLEAAEIGAFYSLASLWNYPVTPEGDTVINKDNLVRGVGGAWWRGPEESFRLGKPVNDARIELLKQTPKYKNFAFNGMYVVPQKTVPAMKVARVGLGIEQHTTYLNGSGDSNILMPSWSAEMLKVYQYTGRDILRKFSRHAIIGRYGNFLGYYIRDYTDIMHSAEYPYEGPDITSFYYHHAPCHFAQSFDYLMTQLEIASKDQIKFPYVRQQGYVWFTDRIFGLPGKVFGEDARPLLSRNAVRADSVKASTFTARAKDGIWCIILNDGAKDETFTLTFDSTDFAMKGAMTDKPIALYDSEGKLLPQKLTFGEQNKVSIPAQSIVAARIPAADYQVHKEIKPITSPAHIKKLDLADGWGDMHAFRIRSPFGKDSLYVVLTDGQGKENSKVELEITSPSKQTITVDAFPYEFSIYPIAQDKPITFSVKIIEDGKVVQQTPEETLLAE